MKDRLQRAFDRVIGTGLDRQYLFELLMTVGVVGMSFVLVALMLMRLTGDAQPTVHQPKPQTEEKTTVSENSEIELGSFKVTMTSSRQLATRGGLADVHILQFDAAVMVHDGIQTRRVEDVFTHYQSRLHATVDSISRGATPDELRDPRLKALRGRIRSKVNRLLGGEVIDKVIVSDFRYYRL